MSVHSFPKQKPQGIPVERYYSAPALTAQPLRPLTALEQMYAYWGSDRA